MENFDPKKEKLPTKLDSDITFEMIAERFLYNHKVLTEIENKRKEITGPLYKAYKQKQDEANKAKEAYEKFEEACRALIDTFLEDKFQQEQATYLSAGTEEARRGAMMLWKPPTYSTPYGELRYRESLECVIEDTSKIPDTFKTIDEKRIKKALEAGLKVPGAKLVRKIVCSPVAHEYERVEHKNWGE
jgi:hypothetical protein